jgi:hypothetical protein
VEVLEFLSDAIERSVFLSFNTLATSLYNYVRVAWRHTWLRVSLAIPGVEDM